MRIVYLGTPDFSVLPLKTIVESGKYEVIGVITNNDKPVGRKQILTQCPVKQYALSIGLKVYSFDKIRLEGVEILKALNPDLMITCAFGQILSQEILDIPKFGVINIHASLLPKYRGASPIHYALLNGEKKTGVTIMKTDAGIDTGDIMFSKEIDILDSDTTGTLFFKLSTLGASMILPAIESIENGSAKFYKQDDSIATYSKIIKKENAKIDFSLSNNGVLNMIRAYNPAPVAYTFYKSEMIKIYSATLSDGIGKEGEIISNDKKIEVACKSGSIIIDKLQKAGGSIIDAKSFLNGNKWQIGEILG